MVYATDVSIQELNFMVYVHERPAAYSFWTLDNTPNDAWQNNHGTNSNMTYSSASPPTFLTQSYNYGQYAVFAPINSADMTKYISLNDVAAMKAVNNFTVMGWIKTSNNWDSQTIIQDWRYDGAWYGWDIRINSSGRLDVLATTGGEVGGCTDNTTTFNTGSWVHFAVTFNSASGFVLYKNFLPIFTGAWAHTIRYNATQGPAIGVRRDSAGGGSNDPFGGNMKDLMFLPTTLTPGQITQIRAYTLGRLVS